MPISSTPQAESNRRSRDLEANLLAELLRTSRLTVLYGEAGSGKTTLLKSGVLPLLHRRATDDAFAWAKSLGIKDHSTVVPFPDRRARNQSSWSGSEVAIFIDAWNEPPLAALQRRIHAALSISSKPAPSVSPPLPETLAGWSRQLGVRFLIILDNFDDLIGAPMDQPGMPEFADEFVRVLNETSLPVNFLVALRNDAGPMLARFRERVPGFGDACVRLLPLHQLQSAPVMLHSVEQPAATRPAEDKSTWLARSRTEWQAAHGAHAAQVASYEPEHVKTSAVEAPIPKRPDFSPPAASAVPTPTTTKTGEDSQNPVAAASVDSANSAENKPLHGPRHQPAPSESAAVTMPGDAPSKSPFTGRETTREARETLSVDAPQQTLESPASAGAAAARHDDHDHMHASIQTMSAEIASLTEADPWRETLRGPAALDASTAAPYADLPARPAGQGRKLMPALIALILLAALGAVFALVLRPSAELAHTALIAQISPQEALPKPERTAPAANSVAPPAVTSPAVTPTVPVPTPVPASAGFEIIADDGNSTDRRVAQDIARFVAGDAGMALGVKSFVNWAESLGALRGQPRLAIAHYDALQAARAGAAPGQQVDSLRIVMPLFAEEIYFIARRNSPLDYIHEIRGARINIGPAPGSRALTAGALYKRMFGARIPLSEISALDEKAALQRLLSDKTIDVMIVVGAQPLALLSGLPAETAHSLKLLELAPNEPETHKALQGYLPATVDSKLSPEKIPTLGVMSFLVTSETTDPDTAKHLSAFASALCASLPALRRDGHPKWRDVRPGSHRDAGWPYSAATDEGFRSCQAKKVVAGNQ